MLSFQYLVAQSSLALASYPRHRLAGAGGKPPQAAWVKSPGRERCGKGVMKASGENPKDEQP